MTKEELKRDMYLKFSMVSTYWLDFIVDYVWELLQKTNDE